MDQNRELSLSIVTQTPPPEGTDITISFGELDAPASAGRS